MRFITGRFRVIVAVAIVALGAVGYGLFGTATVADDKRLASLVIPTTGLANLKARPIEKTAQPPSNASPTVVKQAAASNPAETGVYQVAWRGKTASDEAGVMALVLPTSAQARSASQEFEAQYTNTKKLTAQSLSLSAKFTVSGLPGAFAATYAEKSSSSTGTVPHIYILLFHVGRVAVFVLIQAVGTDITEQQAGSVALAEARYLDKAEPGFSLATTVRPWSRILWFALATVALAGAVLAYPRVLRALADRRERNAERAQLRAHRHVRARGAKVMQRQRAPAWQQRHQGGRRRSRR